MTDSTSFKAVPWTGSIPHDFRAMQICQTCGALVHSVGALAHAKWHMGGDENV